MSKHSFLQEVTSLLENLSSKELKELLLEEVCRLSLQNQNAFLQKLKQLHHDSSNPNTSLSDEQKLLFRIEAFIERLVDGVYFEEWSWEEEGYAIGDESWAQEMDALFSETKEAFDTGQHIEAATAYERLLKAFLLDTEGEIFCGPLPPQEMLKTDLTLAKACYLRARYETTPLQNRAVQLFEEMVELAHIGSWKVFLQTLRSTNPNPLPDLESFLPSWTQTLRSQVKEGQNRFYPKEDLRRELLREAALLKDGVDGLAILAKEEGAWHPETYRDWVDTLWQQGAQSAALEAARQGILHIEDAHEKARLAERLANLAAQTGNRALVFEAYQSAFRAVPSLQRLLSLFHITPNDPHAQETLVKTELESFYQEKYSLSENLAARLELLRANYQAALQSLSEASPLGWGRPEHPGPVVFPALLLTGSGRAWIPRGSSIEELFRVMDEPHLMQLQQENPHSIRNQTIPGYEEYLLATLARHPISSADGRIMLQTLAKIAEKRVRAIMMHKHRKAYQRAARMIVACVEAYHLAVRSGEGIFLLQNLQKEFSRHRLFQKILLQTLQTSFVLLPMLSGLLPKTQ